MMTAVLNFVGALVSTGVAKTIGGDLVMSANLINAEVISAALLGAIIGTWSPGGTEFRVLRHTPLSAVLSGRLW